ncbi:metalloregulator ArsR/SmtB family transcription factor [Paenibacillus sp. J2TS4]|uniref:helix-turn-helix transcriptional regulator n=1 Tax=Paenibacillus sp. J2TS4 TaxID=2807194 RepID=UPI001B11FC40|nr:metalloregulator ArsR/SmtB family transcription factor [Paenibacillus sp. J2TS4]GIP33784.1 transcriptional regulator [Paenibacillus sp. J2TS4]
MSKEQESSTRRMLLTMMKTNGPLSVSEMAKQLGITEMAVRRHLNTLERDGLVETRLSRQAMGRPTHLYSLTESADDLFPKNYHQLTLDLLHELGVEDGEEKIGRLFQLRKEKLLDKYRVQMEGKSLTERVALLADIQNANGYMVEWESGEEGGFVFKEFNCPISQVARQYNEACQCELALFKELLGASVERTECMTKGGRKCTYLIDNKAVKIASGTS